MSKEQFELVRLKSGVNSLRLLSNQETFHPGIGPVAEANILHVDQHRFAERCPADGPFILWDVGLGAAANAIAALERLLAIDAQAEMHSFDRSLGALEFALANADALDYVKPFQAEISTLLAKGEVKIGERITWKLHLGDFRETMHQETIPSPHSIFYDPYSPRGNVDMWNLEHFTALRHRLGSGRPCLLSSYSRSTNIRVTWLLAGFLVGPGTAIGEKEETSLAATHATELTRLLPASWLNRVRVSHSSAPLRGSEYRTGIISPDDLADLVRSPQFLD